MATAIDIGPGATNRSSTQAADYTVVDLANPANDSGYLDVFEVWAATDLTGCKIGTFSGSGLNYNDRDFETIGNVTSGSKQTFTGKNCDVLTGDYLGAYFATGTLEADTSAGSNTYTKSGDWFGTGAQAYSENPGDAVSIYATGITSGQLFMIIF